MIKNHKFRILLALGCPIFLACINIMAVGVAINAISQDLHANITTTQWILSGYMLANATMVIPAGKFCDHYGCKTIFLWSMILFAVFSLLSTLASNIHYLIIFRVIDGLSASCLLASSISLIQHLFEGKERAQFLAKWAFFVGFGTVAGPLVGGWIIHYWQWRGIFAINVPLYIAFILLAYLYLPKNQHLSTTLNIKTLIKPLLAGIWVLGTLLFLTQFSEYQFGNIFFKLLISFIALSLICYFAIFSKVTKSPFTEPSFLIGNFAGFCSYFAMYSWLLLAPLWLMQSWHFNSQETGNALIPYSIMFMLTPLCITKLIKHFQNKTLLLLGLFINMTSFALWMVFNQSGQIFEVMAIFGLLGMGNSFINTPATAITLKEIPKNMSGIGSGIMFSTRWIGGAFGSTTASIIWLKSHNPSSALSAILISITVISFITAWLLKNEVSTTQLK